MAFVADRVHLGQGIVAFMADRVHLGQGIVAIVADKVAPSPRNALIIYPPNLFLPIINPFIAHLSLVQYRL